MDTMLIDGIPVDGGGGGSVVEIEHTLTQNQYENLDSVPFVIVEGIAGEIHIPVYALLRLTVTGAYGGDTTVAIRWAAGQAPITSFATPNLNGARTINILFSIAGATYIDSDHNPIGSDIVMTGSAHVTGGSITNISLKAGYSTLTGY